MEKKKIKLKLCPFCGSDKVEPQYYPENGNCYIRCECTAHGPARDHSIRAAKDWNKRK